MNKFKTVIQKLISLSEMNPSDDNFKTNVENLKADDEINRLSPQQWYSMLESFTVSDCVKIGKGLAMAEAINHWGGGSVAGIIWVYNEISKRDNIEAERLALFVEETWRNLNYDNYWAKFVNQASEKRKAKLIEEEINQLASEQNQIEKFLMQELGMKTWLKRKANFLENELAITKQLQNIRSENESLKENNSILKKYVEELTEKNSELLAKNHQLQSYFNTNERRLLIQKGDAAGCHEKVKIICQNRAFNINSFPESWAKDIVNSLGELDDEEINILFEILNKATSKIWRSLEKKLGENMHNE